MQLGLALEAVDFFFQAEDGIRDADVTGVQTCALPIFAPASGRLGGARKKIRKVLNEHKKLRKELSRMSHGHRKLARRDAGEGFPEVGCGFDIDRLRIKDLIKLRLKILIGKLS